MDAALGAWCHLDAAKHPFGLLLEITCLVGEVLRWLVWLVSIGNVSWETPGFDVAASGRLNAFALVFKGGWLGFFESLLGITFGNVFFVYGKWDEQPYSSGPGDVYPPAYDGKVAIPKNEALYEHELRHTNQYASFRALLPPGAAHIRRVRVGRDPARLPRRLVGARRPRPRRP